LDFSRVWRHFAHFFVGFGGLVITPLSQGLVAFLRIALQQSGIGLLRQTRRRRQAQKDHESKQHRFLPKSTTKKRRASLGLSKRTTGNTGDTGKKGEKAL